MNILYVDGEALTAAISKLEDALGIKQLIFAYGPFFGQFPAARIFYYDSLPTKKDAESKDEFEIRYKDKEVFFSALNKLPRVHVRNGTTRWSKKNGERQKAVDVLLAVDAITHALSGISSAAYVLTNDLDFYPVFDTLRNSKVISHLIFAVRATNSELIESADFAYPLNNTKLLDGCDIGIVEKYKPVIDNHQCPLRQEELKIAVTGMYQGLQIAYWQDDSSQYICFYNNNRARSPSRVLAIEHFKLPNLETVYFSDGEKFT